MEEENNGKKEIQKHIMRYPQLFATKAIEEKLNKGITKGIIWHTQGSGKTALAFYNVKFLTEYYQKQNIVPKLYFVVDRIDLADQTKVAVFEKQRQKNLKQNQQLSQLRDWLLPMLMNGQVSVAAYAYEQAAQAFSMAAEDAAGYGKGK